MFSHQNSYKIHSSYFIKCSAHIPTEHPSNKVQRMLILTLESHFSMLLPVLRDRAQTGPTLKPI
jgi:hypothetical protein